MNVGKQMKLIKRKDRDGGLWHEECARMKFGRKENP